MRVPDIVPARVLPGARARARSIATRWRRVPRGVRTTLTGTAWGLLTLGFLWLAARGLSSEELHAAFAAVRWQWVWIAAACYGVGILVGSLAWAIGLSAGGLPGLPFRHVASCHWIGYGVGAVLPGHLGEAARLLALRRHVVDGPGRASRIAGSMAAQHVLDGIAITILLVAVSLAVPVPGALADLRWAGLGVLVTAPAVVLLARRFRLGGRLVRRLPSRVAGVAASLVSGAGVLARREALPAFACQAVAIGGRFGALVCLGYAFGLQVPISAALVVFALLAAAAVVPAAPGGLGARQAAIVLPLATLYGVAAEQALAFSLGFQATLAAVALAGGAVGLAHQALGRRRRPAPLPAA